MSDETNKTIENLRVLARRARHDQGNDDSALNYYEKMLMEDPNDWEAFFFSNTFKIVEALRDPLTVGSYEFETYYVDLYSFQGEIERAQKALEVTLRLLKEQNPDSNCDFELNEICVELERMMMLTTIPMSAMLTACAMAERPELFSDVVDEYVEILFEPQTKLFFYLGDQEIQKFNNEKAAARAYNANQIQIDAICGADYYAWLDQKTKKTVLNARKEIDQKVKPIIQKQVDDYWTEHAEEKQQLETEKAGLLEKKNRLKRGLDELKGKDYKQEKKEVEEMKGHISTLEARYNKLGLFKKKEKEELQKLITEAKTRLKQMEMSLAEQDEVIKPLQKEYDEVNQKMNKIIGRFAKAERQIKEAFLSQHEEQ